MISLAFLTFFIVLTVLTLFKAAGSGNFILALLTGIALSFLMNFFIQKPVFTLNGILTTIITSLATYIIYMTWRLLSRLLSQRRGR